MTDRDRSTAWFLAQCKPNSYRIAERNLMRQGFRTFIPLQEETRRARSKFVTQLRPLFPGYLFVALDKEQGDLRSVNSTYGITRLVSFGGMPVPVPADLVSQLMMRCDLAGKPLHSTRLKPGEQVLLTKGPFTDFLARIESVDPERRVWVLLDVMGRQTRMAVSEAQVQVASNGGSTQGGHSVEKGAHIALTTGHSATLRPEPRSSHLPG